MSAGPVLRGRRGRDRHVAEDLGRAASGAGRRRALARTDVGGPGRRQPDLSALPPLLAATGSFASLRERCETAGLSYDDRSGNWFGYFARFRA